jgi:pimeloyl-ACP methyl ester carboxylesterase
MPGSRAAACALIFVGLSTCHTGCGTQRVVEPAHEASSYFVKPPTNARLIIFVHGIFGDATSTWTNTDTNVSWPTLLAQDPDLHAYDVFSYGYYSPAVGAASSISEISTRLESELADQGLFKKYREISFITHSMGGLVVKRLLSRLNRSDPMEAERLQRIRAVLFVATPAHGSDIAALGAWIRLNPQLAGMSTQGAKDFLGDLDSDLRTLMRSRNAAHPLPRIFCAYEKLPTISLHIVPDLYSESQCDLDPLALDLNHISIVKPPDRLHEPYIWAKARILETADQGADAEPHQATLPAGHVTVFDGFHDIGRSGFNFESAAVVSWDSGRGDLMVSNHQPPDSPYAFLFAQNEVGVYGNSTWDKGANSGILQMPATQQLDALDECPDSNYSVHWVASQPGSVYCVRTRDGKHYAKIKITDAQIDRLAFDWVYQPNGSRRFVAGS